MLLDEGVPAGEVSSAAEAVGAALRGLQLDAQAVTDHAGHEQGLSSRAQALLDQLNLPLERLSRSQPGAPLPALFELRAEPDDPLLAQLQASRDAAMLQGRLSESFNSGTTSRQRGRAPLYAAWTQFYPRVSPRPAV